MLRSLLSSSSVVRSASLLRNTFRGRLFTSSSSSSPSSSAAAAASTTSAAGSSEVKYYPRGIQAFHWFQAGGFLAAIGLVLAAQQLPNKKNGDPINDKRVETRTEYMNLHKSIAVLMAAAFVPRVALRLTSKIPAPPAGAAWEHITHNVAHGLLYGALLWMPLSGLAMGYYSGFGVPFFGFGRIPGADEKSKDKDLAGFFYKWHTLAGQGLEYLVLAHIGAVGYHFIIKRQNVLTRMLKKN